MAQEWYYTLGGSQNGPVRESDLRLMINTGKLHDGVLVWCEGMASWKPLRDVPTFNQGSTPPPTPAFAASSSRNTAAGPYASPNSGVSPLHYSAANRVPIPTYLWQSIVCTLLCCLPFGIVAIVYASKVDGLISAGRTQEAINASNTAKTWCWLSFGSVAIIFVIYFLFGIAGVLAII